MKLQLMEAMFSNCSVFLTILWSGANKLENNSWIIFDNGTSAENNIQLPQKETIKYLAPMKQNTNDNRIIDNRIIEKFDKEKVERINPQKYS